MCLPSYSRLHLYCLLLALNFLSIFPLLAADPPPRFAPISGSLVIAGGGTLPDDIVEEFIELAGGKQAKLIIIPTASSEADKKDDELLTPWKKFETASLISLHTRDKNQANEAAVVEPLKQATGVWLEGGDQRRLTAAYRGTAVEKELKALLARGGVIGGTSAGAAVMSDLMIAAGSIEAETEAGFGFLPQAVVDQHWLKRNRVNRLLGVLREHPGRVGFGIDEGTALVVKGRDLTVVGSSYVTACLAAGEIRPLRMEVWKAGDRADLMALQRGAYARSQTAHPPAKPTAPDVGKGTLVIGGGGGMSEAIVKRFIEASGGPDALILVLPAALGDVILGEPGEVRMLTRAGAKNVKIFHPAKPQDVFDENFLKPLHTAGGLWFTGGRQWRFVDAFEGSPAVPLFHEVLKRGGAIGGSSAGASIQAEYMVRGNPLGNLDMMAEGYERGFSFLTGAAVDQHFTQRNRFADMTRVMRAHPQLLGIGLDESTSIIVHGQVLEVVGKHQAHIYNRREAAANDGEKDYLSLPAGTRYHLQKREVITD